MSALDRTTESSRTSQHVCFAQEQACTADSSTSLTRVNRSEACWNLGGLSGPAMSKVGGAPIPTALPSCFHRPGFGLAAVDRYSARRRSGEHGCAVRSESDNTSELSLVAGWGIVMRRFILLGILCALSIAGGAAAARLARRPGPIRSIRRISSRRPMTASRGKCQAVLVLYRPANPRSFSSA